MPADLLPTLSYFPLAIAFFTFWWAHQGPGNKQASAINRKAAMSSKLNKIILHPWHRLLGLPRQPRPEWYRDRLREELTEFRAATTRLEKLSETADVFFSLSRAKHDGFPVRDLPRFNTRHLPVYGYVLAKFTSRWAFYRLLAFLCGAPHHSSVREVVNPRKDHKLDEVALRHHIDPEKFKRIGRRLRRVWPLFP